MRYVTAMVSAFDYNNEFDMNYCFECVNNYEFGNSFQTVCGPVSVVGIATGYGLDSPRIESWWGEIFWTDQSWGPPSLLYSGYRVFPGGNEQPGRDTDPTPPSSVMVISGGAIPLLPLWAVWPVQNLSACTRVHFTFTFT